MSNDKIKVKELAVELDVSTKDLLRVLRELNITAKSTMSNISMEDLQKVQLYFNTQSTNHKEERRQVQPGVILRRKRQLSHKDREIHTSNQNDLSVSHTNNTSFDTPSSAPDISQTKQDVAQDLTTQLTDSNSLIKNTTDPLKPEKNSIQSSSTSAKIVAYPSTSLITSANQSESISKDHSEIVIDSDSALNSFIPETTTTTITTTTTKQPPQTEKTTRKPAASAAPEGSSVPSLLPPLSEQSRYITDEEHQNFTIEKKLNGLNYKKDMSSPHVRIISKPNFSYVNSKNSHDTPSIKEQNFKEDQGAISKTHTNKPSYPGNTAGRKTTYQGTDKNNFISADPNTIPNPERDGQSKKKRNTVRKTTDFSNKSQYYEDDDSSILRQNRGKKRSKQRTITKVTTQPIKLTKRKIRVEEVIRVADMAHQMGLKANEIIKILFNLGVMATINMALDIDTATLVAAEFDYEVEKVGFTEEEYLTPTVNDSVESLKRRPPVVTIMGHVDHGKTSLLDAIRKTNVTVGEAGGITQHIGAYHVTTKSGEIVFLDTPGHEAFTTMRARGAQVTDIVVLVVAADDGVMEQTREAVNHARAANVPIMVAVNKMDKPEANPDRVLRELAEIGLVPEDWGGDTIVAKVSAKSLAGIDELLELLALQADILELKANPDKPARGHIVEAKLDKGRGPIATVLIQEGTLHQGDTFVCGVFSGRVRAMFNDQGKKVKEAGPSMPIEVQGFDGVPEAGEAFICLPDEKLARRIAESRAIKQRERELAKESRVTLETFLSRSPDSQETQILNLIVKSDVQGSLEAILDALHKLSTEKVRINIIHGGSGAITESDVLLASASEAIVIGFNVRPTAKVKEVAEQESVDIRFYDIIYKLVDEIKNAMAGLLAPVSREVYLGQADVRELFSVPKIGTIAGSHVSDGKLLRNAGVRLLREGVVVYTGKIVSLRRFKEDVKEVQKGYECGISLENFNDIKLGDVIESFETVEEAAML